MANTCPVCGGSAEATEQHRRLVHTQRAATIVEVNGVAYKVGYNINKQPVLYSAAEGLPKDVFSDLDKVPEAPVVTDAQGNQGVQGK